MSITQNRRGLPLVLGIHVFNRSIFQAWKVLQKEIQCWKVTGNRGFLLYDFGIPGRVSDVRNCVLYVMYILQSNSQKSQLEDAIILHCIIILHYIITWKPCNALLLASLCCAQQTEHVRVDIYKHFVFNVNVYYIYACSVMLHLCRCYCSELNDIGLYSISFKTFTQIQQYKHTHMWTGLTRLTVITAA